MLDGKRCTGVRYTVGRCQREAKAAREVVVCAGAVNSPQLLELSGIGQPERCSELGIEVRQALPGVGENLRDHYAPRTRWLIGAKGITFNDTGPRPWHGQPGDALRFFQATACWPGGCADARIREVARGAGGAGPAAGLGADADRTGTERAEDIAPVGMTCYAHPMRPESKGHIHITSADPRKPPAINFNFLSSPIDAELTVKAIRIARAIMTAPALADWQMTEIGPARPARRTMRSSTG